MQVSEAYQEFLHSTVPIARKMGVEVTSSHDSLVLLARRKPNPGAPDTPHPDHIVTLATLAGYGVVWETLKSERDLMTKGADRSRWRIAIKTQKVVVHTAIFGDLRASCTRP